MGIVNVRFGELQARTAFAGLTPRFAGLYQVNVQVSAGVSGISELQVLCNGTGSNVVIIPFVGK